MRDGERRDRASFGGVKSAAGSGRDESVTAKGFTFELQGCTLSGTSVECLILAENQVADRLLVLTKSSRLFDELGNEYVPQRLRIANTTTGGSGRSLGTFLGGSRFEEAVQKAMIQGVVTPLALSFEGVELQSSGVSLLQLSLLADETRFEVRFRNFPFKAAGR